MKVKEVTKKVIIFLTLPFILSGCSKQQDECEIQGSHVHLYTSDTKNGKLVEYINSEEKEYKGLVKNDQYIMITIDDAEFYKVKDSLFIGKDNWEYLYNIMAQNSQDYLIFYYNYTTTTTEVILDAKGNLRLQNKTVPHNGWSHNPKARGVTGDVKLCHHRYFGYNIIKKNGIYKLITSPLVDDVREIIDEYPFFALSCVKEVSKDYEFDTKDLPQLKAEDFDYYQGPDLENTELENNTK